MNLAAGAIVLVVVGSDGSLDVAESDGPGSPWHPLAPISGPGIALPGAPVTLEAQPAGHVVDAFVTGRDAAVTLFSAPASGGGAWSPAAALPGQPAAGVPSGARIAAVQQPVPGSPPGNPAFRLAVFYADNDGQIWGQSENAAGGWSQPAAVSAKHAIAPGGQIATAVQDGVLSLFWLGPASSGLSGLWHATVASDGTWGTPTPVAASVAFAADGPLSAIVQDVDSLGGRQIDVFTSEADGKIDITWLDAAGQHGPFPMGGSIGLPGDILTFRPSAGTLALAWVDPSGALLVQSVANGTTDPWSVPFALSAASSAPPGAPIATGDPVANGPPSNQGRVELFTVGYGADRRGAVLVTGETDGGAWSPLAPITM
jgi:hypothetical protein